MTKCDVCKNDITELLMGKIKGTYIKANKKTLKICSVCQKTYTVNELKEKVKK